jgi:hypothetical protein
MMETGKGVTYFAQVRHLTVALCGKGFTKDGTDSAMKTGTDSVAYKFAAFYNPIFVNSIIFH